MTREKFNKERNIFIVVYMLAFLVSVYFNNLRMQNIFTIDENFQVNDFHGYTVILAISSIVLIYITYRFSRFLQISRGLIIVYCIMAPLTIIQLVPFILLLKRAGTVSASMSGPSEPTTIDSPDSD